MGTSTSRLGLDPLRTRVNRSRRARARLSSLLICGCSSSQSRLEMEEHPAEVQVSSSKDCNPSINEVQKPSEESSLETSRGTESSSTNAETGTSSESSDQTSEYASGANGLSSDETNKQGKWLSQLTKTQELLAPFQVVIVMIEGFRTGDSLIHMIFGRLFSGINENEQRNNLCPFGVHPDGSCSCDSLLTSDESSIHASISKIVMLAEALFEVLDEIHYRPASFSLPSSSLPAPESVVDSFPLKNHIKLDSAENGEDVQQCHICHSEYEEGDKIRVLPCHHEYHMVCVDKWLKEIHGVCPLCRGDVAQG